MKDRPQPRVEGIQSWLQVDSAGTGYLETKDQEQEAGSRHVEANGDESGESREQVEEEGLVQAF